MLDQIIQDIHRQGWSHQLQVISPERLQTISRLFALDFVPARVGKNQQLQRKQEIRGDLIHWLDPLAPPAELMPEMQLLQTMKAAFNQHFFLGLKDFECHLAKYPAGSFYKKHLDRFEQDSSRSLSFIFYLHQQWTAEDGGELVLYNKKHEVLQTILPEPGSLICFISEEFPHEVKLCHRERRSLTGWMHTKILT